MPKSEQRLEKKINQLSRLYINMEGASSESKRESSVKDLWALWRMPGLARLVSQLIPENTTELDPGDALTRIQIFDASPDVQTSVAVAHSTQFGQPTALDLPTDLREALRGAIPETEEDFENMAKILHGLDILNEMESKRDVLIREVTDSRLGLRCKTGEYGGEMRPPEISALQEIFDDDDMVRATYRSVFLGLRIYALSFQMFRGRRRGAGITTVLALLNAVFPPYAQYPHGILKDTVCRLRILCYVRLVGGQTFTRRDRDALLRSMLEAAGVGQWHDVYAALFGFPGDQLTGYLGHYEQMMTRIHALDLNFPITTHIGSPRRVLSPETSTQRTALTSTARHPNMATPFPLDNISSIPTTRKKSASFSRGASALDIHPALRKSQDTARNGPIKDRQTSLPTVTPRRATSKLWPRPLRTVRKMTSEPTLPSNGGDGGERKKQQPAFLVQGVMHDITSVQDLFKNPKTPRASLEAEKVRREQLAKVASRQQHDKQKENMQPWSRPATPLEPDFCVPTYPEPTNTALVRHTGRGPDQTPAGGWASGSTGPPPRQRLAPRDIRRPSYELSLSPIPGSVRDDMSEDEDRRPRKPSRIPRPFDPHQKSRLGPTGGGGVSDNAMQLARPTSSVYSGDRSSDAATVIVTDDPYKLSFQLEQHPLLNGHRRAISGNDDTSSVMAPPSPAPPAQQPGIRFLEEPVTVSFGRTPPPETPSNRARQATVAIDDKSGGTASSGETYDSLKNIRLQAQAANARRLLYQSTSQRMADAGGQPITITSSASSPGKLSDLSTSPHSPHDASPAPRTKAPSALGTHSRTVSDDRAPSRLGGRRDDTGRPAPAANSEWRLLRSRTPDPMARLEASELQLDAAARQRQLTDSTAKAAAKRAEQEKERLRVRDEQRQRQEDLLARTNNPDLVASQPYENLGDTSLSSDSKGRGGGKKEKPEDEGDNDGAADKGRARRLLSKLKNSLRETFGDDVKGPESPSEERRRRRDSTRARKGVV
ncbi:hypothetical protein MAPG_09503 [Magnaporthiopsis poae ATCC 64411]|uniref:Uncharacterized protein n=1 Tax=Magnaporthiopsis poae (strain ATCC 64411 / 73-15) TaxID=644358 RepID=A0A0C4EA45_MAGP6|nr:hypothetical protein MAPG_09503 [Magnaporthiopsis poae ATCC 64411]